MAPRPWHVHSEFQRCVDTAHAFLKHLQSQALLFSWVIRWQLTRNFPPSVWDPLHLHSGSWNLWICRSVELPAILVSLPLRLNKNQKHGLWAPKPKKNGPQSLIAPVEEPRRCNPESQFRHAPGVELLARLTPRGFLIDTCLETPM